MSGFSISRLSHRLAIQDRPPREKSQSALNKKQDEEVEGEEKSSLGDVKPQQPELSRMPTSDRIDRCNVRNALFDIDDVIALLSYIHISLKELEEKILSFSTLSGQGLFNCLEELEVELQNICIDEKSIFKGELPDCIIHLEQLDIDENDIVLSLQPFVFSYQKLELKNSFGEWSPKLQTSSKDAMLLFASKKIRNTMEICQAYFARMEGLISQILFIYNNLNEQKLTHDQMNEYLTELHHELHWDSLLSSLFENTDLDGIKEISFQYL